MVFTTEGFFEVAIEGWPEVYVYVYIYIYIYDIHIELRFFDSI